MKKLLLATALAALLLAAPPATAPAHPHKVDCEKLRDAVTLWEFVISNATLHKVAGYMVVSNPLAAAELQKLAAEQGTQLVALTKAELKAVPDIQKRFDAIFKAASCPPE